MTRYKVYFENDSQMMGLTELVELLDATPAQVRKLFLLRTVCVINGFEIIAY